MFRDMVLKNRSYRGYDETRQVTRDELLSMVDCARLTAATANIQPLKYFLAYEPETVSKIQPLTGWAKKLKDIKLPHDGQCPTAFIIICMDQTITDQTEIFLKDVGIAGQTILLQAIELGLGGCMLGYFNPKKISDALALPEQFVPMLVVAIGKPVEKIILTEAAEGESVDYYRDENDVHYVPKRKLADIIIK